MRLLKSRSKKSGKKSQYQLFVKINANRAADLVLNDDRVHPGKKNLNPVLVALLNKTKRRTARKLNTNHPSWDDSISLPLKTGDFSQLLNLSVWDKHKRYKSYLGEVRFTVGDIFFKDGVFTSQTDLRWYKLYSNKINHSFVTGSLLVSFELVVKQRKRRARTKRRNKESESDDDEQPPVAVNVIPPSRQNTLDADLFNRMDALNVSEADLVPINADVDEQQQLLQEWLNSLLIQEVGINSTQPNDQGFYSDAEEILPVVQADISDVESIGAHSQSSKSSNSLRTKGSNNPLQILHYNQKNGLISDLKPDNQHLSITGDEEGASMSDSSMISSDNTLKSEANDSEAPKGSPKKRKFHRRSKLHENFAVKNRKVLGVLFLEIVSCSDLPPVRNMTRMSFDMDPFVVVTFGKKTFRTSWKRHTLDPIFNERLAFEVLDHEDNYNIQFSVLDKDRFSYNDNVADISVLMKDLKTVATQQNEPKKEVVEVEEEDKIHLPYDSSGILDIDDKHKSIQIVDDKNLVESIKRKKFVRRKKVMMEYADTSNFKTMHLKLDLHDAKFAGKYNPMLKIRARFQPYDSLRKQFFKILLEQQYNFFGGQLGKFDFIELISLLDALGCEASDEVASKFFEQHQKSKWGGDVLTNEEVIECFEEHVSSTSHSEYKIFEIEKCPLCCQKSLAKKQDTDIITHVAICASKDWSIVNKLLVSSYVTPQIATKRWFSKVLIKLTYGNYKLGGNSANILVQDRVTGIIMEEKMGVYVRLGIRLLYKGLDKAKTKRMRNLLRKLSIKQGEKFDHPSLANDIESFIKFHKLDLSECIITDPRKYPTFNDFFYRKLKPGARPNESPDERRVVVSPADCRCTTFETVDKATELWIKGRNFTLPKLFNGNFDNLQDSDLFKPGKCSLGIFRLAPQDYHRFHSPIDGRIKAIKYIEGEYYTVNPMAIRSDLDVFGENVRVLIAIETEDFGTVIMIAVGAMMVGSTVLSVGEGDTIKRGDEVGYFKFGGSTIILLFEKSKFQFDSDLINNSSSCIESLVRVGQSIGHSPAVPEFKRSHIDFEAQSKEFKLNLIRVITGGDLNDTGDISNWESHNIKLTSDDIENLIKTRAEDGYLESDNELEESEDSDEYEELINSE